MKTTPQEAAKELAKFKKLIPIKKKNAGCLCCEGLGHEIKLDTVLYQGFGGWMITKNGELFFMDESNKEWDEFKTLAFIEKKAKLEASADWRAICDTPLHGEVYQRQRGKWLLVEENLGFA